MKRFLTLLAFFCLGGSGYAQQWAPVEAWTPEPGPRVFLTQCPGGQCPIPQGGYYYAPPAQPIAPQGSPQGQLGSASVDPRLTAASVRVLYELGGGRANSGSGTAFTPEGHILTCWHVVPDGRTTITVRWPNGRQEVARFVASDRGPDLACIQVAATSDYIPLATATPNQGGSIFQVGYPHGVGPRGRTGTVRGFQGRDLWLTSLVDGGDSGGGVFRADDLGLCGVVSRKNTERGPGNGICAQAADMHRFAKEVCRIDFSFGIFGKPRQPAPVPPQPIPPGKYFDPAPLNPPAPIAPPSNPLADAVARLEANHKGLADTLEAIKGDVAAVKGQAPIPGPAGPAGQPGAPGMGVPQDKLEKLDKAIEIANGAATIAASIPGPWQPWAIGGSALLGLLGTGLHFMKRRGTQAGAVPLGVGIPAAPAPSLPPVYFPPQPASPQYGPAPQYLPTAPPAPQQSTLVPVSVPELLPRATMQALDSLINVPGMMDPIMRIRNTAKVIAAGSQQTKGA